MSTNKISSNMWIVVDPLGSTFSRPATWQMTLNTCSCMDSLHSHAHHFLSSHIHFKTLLHVSISGRHELHNFRCATCVKIAHCVAASHFVMLYDFLTETLIYTDLLHSWDISGFRQGRLLTLSLLVRKPGIIMVRWTNSSWSHGSIEVLPIM